MIKCPVCREKLKEKSLLRHVREKHVKRWRAPVNGSLTIEKPMEFITAEFAIQAVTYRDRRFLVCSKTCEKVSRHFFRA